MDLGIGGLRAEAEWLGDIIPQMRYQMENEMHHVCILNPKP